MDVRVDGNRTVATHKIMGQIHTRSGRPYNVQNVQDDVRALTRMGLFVDVRPFVDRVQPNGVVIVFRVTERPLLQDVIIIGNDEYKNSVLKKEAEIKTGDAADPFAVENGRRKIEKYYQDHGYSKARVTVLEGNKTGDLRVIYVVDEGPQQKVYWVNFVGNQFVSGQRLKTLIDTHPPYFYLFSGEYDRKKLDEDVSKLTAYYRGFGYFHARIGRELEFNDKQNWVTVTFVIDEGPRYSIRNISFLGNRKFDNTRLAAKLKLLSDQPFDQNQQNLDLQQLRDEYGSEGYVFAKVEADNRFLEEQDKLDIVYNIEEGDRYHIGRINIEIKGENPHTQINTVLDRLSIKTGDIADTREIRASERRLKAAQLFKVEPRQGVEPKIVYSPPDSDGTAVAGGRRQTTYYRFGEGPLPPLPEGERYMELDYGEPQRGGEVKDNQDSASPPPTYQTNMAPSTDAPLAYQPNSVGWTSQSVQEGLASPQTQPMNDGRGGPSYAAPQTYAGQAPAGPQTPSNPIIYEVHYQSNEGWSAPQQQGQSWPPNADTGSNNANPAQPQNYPPPQQPRQYGNSQQPPYAAAPPTQQYAYAQQAQVYPPPQQPRQSSCPRRNRRSCRRPTVPATQYAAQKSIAPTLVSLPPIYAPPPPPAYGPPAGAGPANTYPSAPPPATGASGGGAIYTPANPAAAPPANGPSLFVDPAATMFPQAPGEPLQDLPIGIDPQETQTGRLMFGVGVNFRCRSGRQRRDRRQNFRLKRNDAQQLGRRDGRPRACGAASSRRALPRGIGARHRGPAAHMMPGTSTLASSRTKALASASAVSITSGSATEWTENRVGSCCEVSASGSRTT